jgi:phosphoserine aminotransferase
MSTADFDELERDALAEAAKAGMAYLKSLPDAGPLRAAFAALEPDQAMEFLERIVDGFGAHMKFRLVADHRPPTASQGGR